jgi:hypothetical protein
MKDLLALAMPFPNKVIHKNPSGGGSYVSHHLYTQRLLLHLGAYSFTLVKELRGHVAGKPPNPNGSSQRAKDGTPDLTDAVVGAICRLSVVVDNERIDIDEVGDCEDPHNWNNDGARMKDAMSDALKRCCARIGLGTHLYAKTEDEFFLYRKLKEDAGPAEPREVPGPDTYEPPREVGINDVAEAYDGRPFE